MAKRKSGAQPGNQNAAKGKRWEAAIIRAIERYKDPEAGKDQPKPKSKLMEGIDAAAEAFVAQMMATKDLGFFREFGDRIDGKVKQQLELGGIPENPIRVQPWNLQPVKPAAK